MLDDGGDCWPRGCSRSGRCPSVALGGCPCCPMRGGSDEGAPLPPRPLGGGCRRSPCAFAPSPVAEAPVLPCGGGPCGRPGAVSVDVWGVEGGCIRSCAHTAVLARARTSTETEVTAFTDCMQHPLGRDRRPIPPCPRYVLRRSFIPRLNLGIQVAMPNASNAMSTDRRVLPPSSRNASTSLRSHQSMSTTPKFAAA